MALILDTDLLCIERGGRSYKWTGGELKSQITGLAPVQSLVGVDPIVVDVVSNAYSISIKDASTSQKGATILTNTVDTREDRALTPKGAKDALDLKANSDGSNATGTWNISITGNSPGSDFSTDSENAQNIYVERDDDSNANRYLTFVDNSTAGNKRLNMDNGLIYNPSINTLTATTFKGDLTGTASKATSSDSATNAINSDNTTNVNVLSDPNTGNVRYLNFTANTSGNTRIRTDTGLTYYPSNNTLVTGNLQLSGNISAANITTTSNLSVKNLTVSGETRVSTLTVTGGMSGVNLSLSSDLTVRNITATGDLTCRQIRASSTISTSGTISAGNLSISGSISTSSLSVSSLSVSGTLSARWITTTSGKTTSSISRVYASQDSYIRWCTPNHLANSMSNVVKTSNNSSLNSDSRNTRGVTRLYRRESNSDYSVQTYWTGAHWMLYGYQGDGGHAGCRVALADSATSAGTSDSVTIRYNNNSNSNYQMLWGSGNNVYGTAGIVCNPNSNKIYTNGQELATVNYVNSNRPAAKTLTASRQWSVTGSNWPYGYAIPSLYQVQATTSLYNQGGGRVRVGANQFYVDCPQGVYGSGWVRNNVGGSWIQSDGSFLGARSSSRATKMGITYETDHQMRSKNNEMIDKFMSLKFAKFEYDPKHYLNRNGGEGIKGTKFGLIAEDVQKIDPSWVVALPTTTYDGETDSEVPIDKYNTDQHYSLNEYDIVMTSMFVTKKTRLDNLVLQKKVEELTAQVEELKQLIQNTK